MGTLPHPAIAGRRSGSLLCVAASLPAFLVTCCSVPVCGGQLASPHDVFQWWSLGPSESGPVARLCWGSQSSPLPTLCKCGPAPRLMGAGGCWGYRVPGGLLGHTTEATQTAGCTGSPQRLPCSRAVALLVRRRARICWGACLLHPEDAAVNELWCMHQDPAFTQGWEWCRLDRACSLPCCEGWCSSLLSCGLRKGREGNGSFFLHCCRRPCFLCLCAWFGRSSVEEFAAWGTCCAGDTVGWCQHKAVLCYVGHVCMRARHKALQGSRCEAAWDAAACVVVGDRCAGWLLHMPDTHACSLLVCWTVRLRVCVFHTGADTSNRRQSGRTAAALYNGSERSCSPETGDRAWAVCRERVGME